MLKDGKRIASGSEDGTLRVWDVASGGSVLTRALFPGGEHAVIEERPRRLRRATPGAWRWLGWLIPHPQTGVLERYPAELFRPLPGAECERAAEG